VTETASPSTVILGDVLLGTVIVASGQSNMEFTLPTIFGGQSIVRNASLVSVPTLRLLTVAKIPSEQPLDDVPGLEHSWRSSSPATICGQNETDPEQPDYCIPHCGPSSVVPSFKRPTWGYFSAMGWLTGRQLMLAHGLKTVGVVATSWGGTSIKLWSDTAALETCGSSGSSSSSATDLESSGGTEGAAGVGPSQLYNAMIHPLLGMPVRGFVWYQGEADSGSFEKASAYACQLPTMVRSWRSGWVSIPSSRREEQGTPFVAVQLAPWVTSPSVMDLRLSQTNVTSAGPGASYVPAIDRADPTSPCGDVHIRGKLQLGQRVAARMASAWGLPAGPSGNTGTGPVPETASISGAASVLVTLSVASEHQLPLRRLAIQNQTTAEATSNTDVLMGTAVESATWVRANFTIVPPSRVGGCSSGTYGGAVDAGHLAVQVPDGASTDVLVLGVRYAWDCVPAGEQVVDAGAVPMAPWAFLVTDASHDGAPETPTLVPAPVGKQLPGKNGKLSCN